MATSTAAQDLHLDASNHVAAINRQVTLEEEMLSLGVERYGATNQTATEKDEASLLKANTQRVNTASTISRPAKYENQTAKRYLWCLKALLSTVLGPTRRSA